MSEASRPNKKGEEVNLKQSGNGWAYDSGRNTGIDEYDNYLSDKVVLKREALSCEKLADIFYKNTSAGRKCCDDMANDIFKYIEENKV